MATALRLLSLNDVKMVGRLTRDPEVRYTQQGSPVCHFRIAVGRNYKDKNSGDWREEVAFVPCVTWRETAERCQARLKKGSPVFVEGRLKSRDWQTKEGQKRFELELDVMRVQFLEAMGQEEGGESQEKSTTQQEEALPVGVGNVPGAAESRESNVNDDEVPF